MKNRSRALLWATSVITVILRKVGRKKMWQRKGGEAKGLWMQGLEQYGQVKDRESLLGDKIHNMV